MLTSYTIICISFEIIFVCLTLMNLIKTSPLHLGFYFFVLFFREGEGGIKEKCLFAAPAHRRENQKVFFISKVGCSQARDPLLWPVVGGH